MLYAHLVYILPQSQNWLFFQEPWFLLLENGIKNQDVGSRCAHCYWDVIARRPSQLTEQGNMCVGTNLCTHIYK